jgi:hypothetical protein
MILLTQPHRSFKNENKIKKYSLVIAALAASGRIRLLFTPAVDPCAAEIGKKTAISQVQQKPAEDKKSSIF